MVGSYNNKINWESGENENDTKRVINWYGVTRMDVLNKRKRLWSGHRWKLKLICVLRFKKMVVGLIVLVVILYIYHLMGSGLPQVLRVESRLKVDWKRIENGLKTDLQRIESGFTADWKRFGADWKKFAVDWKRFVADLKRFVADLKRLCGGSKTVVWRI